MKYLPLILAIYLALCLIVIALLFRHALYRRREELRRARATAPIAEHTLHLSDYARLPMVAERLELRPSRREPQMSRRNIAAFTAAESSYADYVSINQEGEDHVSIATRSNNGKSHSTIVMPTSEFNQLADSITSWRAQK